MGRPVSFIQDTCGAAAERAVALRAPGDIAVLENTRFEPGETKNDPALFAAIAKPGDTYVNDAFFAANRAPASTEGLGHLLPASAARPMRATREHLTAAVGTPQRPRDAGHG